MTAGSWVTALGFMVGAVVFFLASRERELNTEGVGYLALWGVLGGLLGAKLGQSSVDPTALLDPQFGGRTVLGGVLGGWLAVEIGKKVLGIHRSTGDMFALALAAGEAVGRVGCFLNGCCYGKPSTVSWAVYQHGEWRHPTQIYSSLVALLIFVLLTGVRGRMKREGQLFGLYLVLWASARFILEFFRTNPLWLGGITLAQGACIVVAALGMLWWKPWR